MFLDQRTNMFSSPASESLSGITLQSFVMPDNDPWDRFFYDADNNHDRFLCNCGGAAFGMPKSINRMMYMSGVYK